MNLPDGYRVERDPDVWTLIGPGEPREREPEEVVARFAAGAPDEEIERAALAHERLYGPSR